MSGELELNATPKPKPKRSLFGWLRHGKSMEQPKGKTMSQGGLLGGLTGLHATWPQEEAFIAILYATALVDGDVHADEMEEIKALGHRLRVFEKKTAAEIDAIIEKVRGKITWDRKGDFPWSQVEGACGALAKKHLGQTVFTNACDIVFADGVIEQTEVDLLTRIASKLELPAALANSIIEVIKIKNGHNE